MRNNNCVILSKKRNTQLELTSSNKVTKAIVSTSLLKENSSHKNDRPLLHSQRRCLSIMMETTSVRSLWWRTQCVKQASKPRLTAELFTSNVTPSSVYWAQWRRFCSAIWTNIKSTWFNEHYTFHHYQYHRIIMTVYLQKIKIHHCST